MADLKMVAEQEHELRQKERLDEEEKNKFIEIVSDNENELVSEAKQEAEKQQSQPKRSFEPNVYETFDAATGLKIEESSVESLSQQAIQDAENQTPSSQAPAQPAKALPQTKPE